MRRCGTWAKHARVPLRCVRAGEGAGRLFSTPSRPALRAAACGGRPRAGSDMTATVADLTLTQAGAQEGSGYRPVTLGRPEPATETRCNVPHVVRAVRNDPSV